MVRKTNVRVLGNIQTESRLESGVTQVSFSCFVLAVREERGMENGGCLGRES